MSKNLNPNDNHSQIHGHHYHRHHLHHQLHPHLHHHHQTHQNIRDYNLNSMDTDARNLNNPALHSPPHHHKKRVEPCHGNHENHLADDSTHSFDLVTTLRSELAASAYKRDRLTHELTEAKSSLCAKEAECESLRSQTARQSALIGSLQSRLQTVENRERNLQARSDTSIQTLGHEKRCLEEKNKDLVSRLRRLESDAANEESHKNQARAQLHEFVQKLCICLGIDLCESTQTPDCVLSKAGEIVTELQRLRTKMTSTCESLSCCESELVSVKSIANVEKQRLNTQIETMQMHHQELEARCRQAERELQITRDRLTECEINGEKLREEIRGFESRCHRLQSNLDRFQSDRMQFLRQIASALCVPEPCETLVKDKVREIITENQTIHSQLDNLREQIATNVVRHQELEDATNLRLRAAESQKTALEERLEKAHAEIEDLRSEHICLSEYLVRMARALSWSECSSPPARGTDTTILAESLLERAERLAAHHEHHIHSCDKGCWDHNCTGKLKRERSCHEIPLKDSSTMYALQRRVRVLREQVQRRDLHLELLRRKIALLEDAMRGRTHLQGERDDALNKVRRSTKQAEKASTQLIDAKAQLNELKTQMAEAAEHKITALERARKIDELNARVCDLENERSHLQSQINSLKDRAKSVSDNAQDRRCRDEDLINSLRDEIAHLKTELIDANHRISHLQTFRASVARTLHLRDIPESDLLNRLQTLCNAHQEFTMLSRRYESASPLGGDRSCSRYDDLPTSSLPR